MNPTTPNQTPAAADLSIERAPVLNDPEVIDLAPFPLAITDLETGDFVYLNELVCEVLGIDRDSEAKPNLASLYCDLDFRAKAVEKILQDGEVRDVEVPLKRSDGTVIWVLGSARLVRFRGRLSALIAIVDISKIKQLTEDLGKARQELEKALSVQAELQKNLERDSEAKSTLLINLSHEIRTPLNGLLGMSEILLDEDIDSGQRTLVEAIRKAALSLHAVTTEILEHTELESKDAEPEATAADPVEIIGQAIRQVARNLDGKPVEVATIVGPEVPRKVNIDAHRFGLALFHVLDNAVKFTDKGTIKIECSHSLDCLTIRVSDTGIGIPADRIGDIFHEFLQVDGSSIRRHGGIGLGLSIAKKAVESLGGEVHVLSEEGLGSEFALIVPAPAVAPPRKRDLMAVGCTGAVYSESDEMAQMLERICAFKGYEPRRLPLNVWAGKVDLFDSLFLVDLPNDPERVEDILGRLNDLPPSVRKNTLCLAHPATMPEPAEIDRLQPIRFLAKPTDPLTVCKALDCEETWNSASMEELRQVFSVSEECCAKEIEPVFLPLSEAVECDWSEFDGGFVKRIASLLGESCEMCLEGISLGIDRKDPVLIYAYAYHLHGSALNAGARSTAQLCRNLLAAAKAKDFELAARLLPQIQADLAAFQESISWQLSRKEA